jgi:hypothetical protein
MNHESRAVNQGRERIGVVVETVEDAEADFDGCLVA